MSRIDASIAKAFAPIEQRLEEIEARVATGEERITNYLAACNSNASASAAANGGGISPVVAAIGFSRPASGDSNNNNNNNSAKGYLGVSFTSFPEHSNPLFNDALLRAKFDAYDNARRGYITRSQLMHFYRTHNSFAYDATDDDVMDALVDLTKGSRYDTEHVSFDCFCAIALKLAKS